MRLKCQWEGRILQGRVSQDDGKSEPAPAIYIWIRLILMMISTLLSWYDLRWLRTQFFNEMIRLVILFHVNISSLKQGSHYFSFPSLQSIAAPHSAQLWIDTTSSLQLGSTHAIHTIDTQTNKYNKHTNKVVEVEGIAVLSKYTKATKHSQISSTIRKWW